MMGGEAGYDTGLSIRRRLDPRGDRYEVIEKNVKGRADRWGTAVLAD
jgi:hypothetical protein